MSEQRIAYTIPALVTGDQPAPFELAEWERNFILRLRQAANAGQMILCDPDSRCWWATGRMECNKADRGLPFSM